MVGRALRSAAGSDCPVFRKRQWTSVRLHFVPAILERTYVTLQAPGLPVEPFPDEFPVGLGHAAPVRQAEQAVACAALGRASARKAPLVRLDEIDPQVEKGIQIDLRAVVLQSYPEVELLKFAQAQFLAKPALARFKFVGGR